MKGRGNAMRAEKRGIKDARTKYNFSGVLESKTKARRTMNRAPKNTIFFNTTAQIINETKEMSLIRVSNRCTTESILVVLSVSKVSLKKVNNSSIPTGFFKSKPPRLESEPLPTNSGQVQIPKKWLSQPLKYTPF
jgi:hypothetical protein